MENLKEIDSFDKSNGKSERNRQFFRKVRKDGTPYGPVYTKGDYDRSEKAYDCGKYEDICESSLFKPAAKVYAGFTY